MRSSWEASATNRRIRASDAVRASNARSIWVSIPLSATPSRPTSVPSGACGTRCDRSPAAMAAAVPSISRSGRIDRRTAQPPARPPTRTMARPDSSRAEAISPVIFCTSPSGRAMTTVPTGVFASVRGYATARQVTSELDECTVNGCRLMVATCAVVSDGRLGVP